MQDMNATSAHGEGVQFYVRPKCLVFMAIAAVGTSAVFFVLWPIILGLIGWTSIGPSAGSAAAAWQATMGGSVAGGSLFATLQSAAMGGGAGLAAMVTTGLTVTGAVGTSAAAFCGLVCGDCM